MFNVTLEVGDEVVVQHHWQSHGLRRVKRVMKKFIELDDGTKWNPETGYPYPHRNSYGGSYLVEVTHEMRLEIEAGKLKCAIHIWAKHGLKDAGIEKLRAVWKAIKEEE